MPTAPGPPTPNPRPRPTPATATRAAPSRVAPPRRPGAAPEGAGGRARNVGGANPVPAPYDPPASTDRGILGGAAESESGRYDPNWRDAVADTVGGFPRPGPFVGNGGSVRHAAGHRRRPQRPHQDRLASIPQDRRRDRGPAAGLQQQQGGGGHNHNGNRRHPTSLPGSVNHSVVYRNDAPPKLSREQSSTIMPAEMPTFDSNLSYATTGEKQDRYAGGKGDDDCGSPPPCVLREPPTIGGILSLESTRAAASVVPAIDSKLSLASLGEKLGFYGGPSPGASREPPFATGAAPSIDSILPKVSTKAAASVVPAIVSNFSLAALGEKLEFYGGPSPGASREPPLATGAAPSIDSILPTISTKTAMSVVPAIVSNLSLAALGEKLGFYGGPSPSASREPPFATEAAPSIDSIPPSASTKAAMSAVPAIDGSLPLATLEEELGFYSGPTPGASREPPFATGAAAAPTIDGITTSASTGAAASVAPAIGGNLPLPTLEEELGFYGGPPPSASREPPFATEAAAAAPTIDRITSLVSTGSAVPAINGNQSLATLEEKQDRYVGMEQQPLRQQRQQQALTPREEQAGGHRRKNTAGALMTNADVSVGYGASNNSATTSNSEYNANNLVGGGIMTGGGNANDNGYINARDDNSSPRRPHPLPAIRLLTNNDNCYNNAREGGPGPAIRYGSGDGQNSLSPTQELNYRLPVGLKNGYGNRMQQQHHMQPQLQVQQQHQVQYHHHHQQQQQRESNHAMQAENLRFGSTQGRQTIHQYGDYNDHNNGMVQHRDNVYGRGTQHQASPLNVFNNEPPPTMNGIGSHPPAIPNNRNMQYQQRAQPQHPPQNGYNFNSSNNAASPGDGNRIIDNHPYHRADQSPADYHAPQTTTAAANNDFSSSPTSPPPHPRFEV